MTSIKKLLSALLLVLCSSGYSNAQLAIDPVTTQTHSISDDGYANVPLQFAFPYYGQTFTNSWMFSNGIVSFVDPAQSGLAGWQNLNVQPFSSTMGSQYNYSIYALWTDLINIAGTFKTEGSTGFQRYSWIGISPYYDQNRLNTFSVEIRPDGKIITNYHAIDANYAGVGTTGNTSAGEYEQIAFHSSRVTTGMIPNWERYTFDMCTVNPLSSPTCSGYAQAYYNYQCSTNPLYDSGCPGYTEAYFSQQCSINPLYNQSCAGYAQAYFEYQCNLNPLYNAGCSGYAQAYALQNLQQQTTTVETYTVPIATVTVTSSSPTVALADPTKTETVVTTDVGGVELNLSGQISIPTGQTAATREAIKEAVKEAPPEEKKKTVNPRALAIAQNAVRESERLSLTVVTDSIAISNGDAIAAEAGIGTGSLNSGSRSSDSASAVTDAQAGNQNKQQSTINLQNINPLAAQQEVQQKNGPSVRNGGRVDGLDGGPDPAQFSRSPMDFNQYLQAQMQDSQMYSTREIYRNQTPVDNQRLLRGLTQGTDALHRQMVDQQFNIGN